MNPEQASCIDEFFAVVEKLKTLSIIRSHKYLGDIAEFICTSQFGMSLAHSGRQPGHDGLIGDARVQVKFNGATSTTVDCGDPDEYDELIVVLGPSSVLRPASRSERYVVYRISSDRVKTKTPHSDGKRRYSKGQLQSQWLVGPDSE